MAKWFSRHWKNTYAWMIIIFFYIPFIPLMVFSFNESRSLTSWTNFSTIWYSELFTDRRISEAIFNTLAIAIMATAISTFVGTLAAIALTRSKKIVREAILSINDVPIVNPEIVTAVALLLFYISFQFDLGYFTMLLSHIAFCTPYVIITMYPKVKSLDKNIVEAAQDLGASPWQALWKVLIPQIKPSIFAAAAIAFTMSFDDFIISYFTSGTVQNISIFLYTTKRRDPSVNALSTILIILILTGVLWNYFSKNKKQIVEER